MPRRRKIEEHLKQEAIKTLEEKTDMTTKIQYALFNQPIDPTQVDPRDAWLFNHPFKVFDEGKTIEEIEQDMVKSLTTSLGDKREIGEFKRVEARVVLRERYVLRTPYRSVEN